jgi:hypothetical protein
MLGARQSGRTTRQMQGAPKRSVFVWCNGQLDYPKSLAQRLGRSDLAIVGPSWLSSGAGRRFPGVVLDHNLSQSDDWRVRAAIHAMS